MPHPPQQLPLWSEPTPPREKTTGGEVRKVLLGEHVVHYALHRSRRRTIGLTIDGRGLRVRAPLRATLGSIEGLIRRHAAWVIEKIDHWQARPSAVPTVVQDGLVVPVLARPVELRVVEGANRYRWAPEGQALLMLEVRPGASAAALLERALREHALADFARRLATFCNEFALAPPSLRLSSARTRWGSCSRKSGIRLNWRLIHAEATLIDYVLAHELAHLKEMNHSPRFWAEVGVLYPGYAEARRALQVFGEGMPHYA
jgi:predicted metal-dependent hydrolase